MGCRKDKANLAAYTSTNGSDLAPKLLPPHNWMTSTFEVGRDNSFASTSRIYWASLPEEKMRKEPLEKGMAKTDGNSKKAASLRGVYHVPETRVAAS